MIRLGDEVQDKVTGAKGIVVALTVWLNGCIRASIQQKVEKDNKVPDTFCVDVAQLKVITSGKIIGENSDKLCIPNELEMKTKGGPRPSPKRLPDPTR